MSPHLSPPWPWPSPAFSVASTGSLRTCLDQEHLKHVVLLLQLPFRSASALAHSVFSTFVPPAPLPEMLSPFSLPSDLLSPLEKELRCYLLLETSPTSLERVGQASVPTAVPDHFYTIYYIVLQFSSCSDQRGHVLLCLFPCVCFCLLATCLSIAGWNDHHWPNGEK